MIHCWFGSHLSLRRPLKRAFLILLVLLTSETWSLAGLQNQGRLQFIAGTKQLKKSDWEPFDKQSEWGLEFDYKKPQWPVWITVGGLQSQDRVTLYNQPTVGESIKLESKTLEIHTGAKRDLDLSRSIRLSLSGGPAWIQADLDRMTTPFDQDRNSTVGLWGTADILILVRGVGLGFSYRISKGSVTLHNQKRDAGGQHLVFSAGLTW